MQLTQPIANARYPSWRYRQNISFDRGSHEALLESVKRWCHERGMDFNVNEYVRHLIWEDRDGEITSLKDEEIDAYASS